jgi:hypothetical protein
MHARGGGNLKKVKRCAIAGEEKGGPEEGCIEENGRSSTRRFFKAWELDVSYKRSS